MYVIVECRPMMTIFAITGFKLRINVLQSFIYYLLLFLSEFFWYSCTIEI